MTCSSTQQTLFFIFIEEKNIIYFVFYCKKTIKAREMQKPTKVFESI
jgi:hypothetical protein